MSQSISRLNQQGQKKSDQNTVPYTGEFLSLSLLSWNNHFDLLRVQFAYIRVTGGDCQNSIIKSLLIPI